MRGVFSKGHFRVLVVVLTFLTVCLASLKLNPYKARQTLWVRDQAFHGLYWDAGYGFSEEQVQPALDLDRKLFLQGSGDPFLFAIDFGRWDQVRSVEIHSGRPDVRLLLEQGGERMDLTLQRSGRRGDYRYRASLPPKLKVARPPVAKLFFVIGIVLWGAVISGWIIILCELALGWAGGNRQSAKLFLLGLVILAGLAGTTLAFYPGIINVNDPPPLLIVAQHYFFGVSYSYFLAAGWTALLDVFSRPGFFLYTLLFFQSLAFALLLFYGVIRLTERGWSFGLAATAALVIFFAPVGLVCRFFLSRAITAGMVNFLFWLEMYFVLTPVKGGRAQRHVLFGFLMILSTVIRFDFIPFALMAGAIVFWRKPRAPANFLFLAGMIAVLFYLPFPLSGLEYPLRDYVKRAVSRQHPDASEAAVGGDTALDVATNYVSIVVAKPKEFLRQRLLLIEEGFGSEQHIGPDLNDISFNRDYMLPPLLRLHELPSASLEEVGRMGLYGQHWLLAAAWRISIQSLIPFFFILVALGLGARFPSLGLIALCAFLRALFILVAAPRISFQYIFDLHLIGMFLLFALVRELILRCRRVGHAPTG